MAPLKQKSGEWKEWIRDAASLALPILVIARLYYLLTIFFTGFFPLWAALLIAVPLGVVIPLVLMILWGAGGLVNIKVSGFVILAVALIVGPALWITKRYPPRRPNMPTSPAPTRTHP